MCGRFSLHVDINTVAQHFVVPATLKTSPRYNVAPTQEVVSIMRNGPRTWPCCVGLSVHGSRRIDWFQNDKRSR